MDKNKIMIYLCIAIFGILGIYLTFFYSNTSKYDSETTAYRIDANERYDDEDGTLYYPIYHFKVDGRDYECKTKGGSSFSPNESKNKVYYDSTNPTNCMTQYDGGTSKVLGIICLVVTAIIAYFFVIKKPTNIITERDHVEEMSPEMQYQTEQNVQKAYEIVNKVQLIYKRVILGVVILILLVLVLIDTAIFKQTIIARNYIDVTATFVDIKNIEEDSIIKDYIYTFQDRQGKKQEIIVTSSNSPEDEMHIKYNENNPQDFYEDGATFDTSGIIWYIVKLVALVLLIILFFNKKWLNKINVSASSN